MNKRFLLTSGLVALCLGISSCVAVNEIKVKDYSCTLYWSGKICAKSNTPKARVCQSGTEDKDEEITISYSGFKFREDALEALNRCLNPEEYPSEETEDTSENLRY